MSHRCPPRLRTFSYIGLHRYFLTFCTCSRRSHFKSQATVGLVLSQILRAADDEQFEILAYCFMPDHLHLLVDGRTEQSDARRFISKAKQFSGYAHSKTNAGRLWQRYSYEHVLRDEEATLSIARYIVENPVRSGLVRSVEQYPFVGSCRYSLGEILDAIAINPRSG